MIDVTDRPDIAMRLCPLEFFLAHYPAPLEFSHAQSKDLGVFGLNLPGFARGDLFIMIELHRVIGAALAEGSQLIDIAKHIGEWNHRIDDHRIAAHILALDLPAPAEKVAHH